MLRKPIFIAFLALVLTLSACGISSQPATEIVVQETDFAYSPVTITVPLNQSVTVVFKNTGAVEHDFVIEEINVMNLQKDDAEAQGMSGHDMGGVSDPHYDLHVSTLPGKSSTIEFTPTEAGTYEFFCTVKGHLEAGMIGKLVVLVQ